MNECGSYTLVDTPEKKVTTGGSYLQTFRFAGDRAEFVRNVLVPSGADDPVLEAGTPVLLGSTASDTYVTRIVDGAATIAAYLEGETRPSSFGGPEGARVFVTRASESRVRVRRLDGSLVAEGDLR